MVESSLGRGSRVGNVLLVVLFLSAISLPMGLKVLGIETASMEENRVKAARPTLKFEKTALAEYPSQFEAYFNDSFGMRDKLIRWNNLVKVRSLGVSSSQQVLIGRKGWLYYTADGSLEDYRRNKPFTNENLEDWRLALEAKRDYLAARGIRYLVVVAPNKHTIYPEFVPRTITQIHKESRLDQLSAYLRSRSNVPVLDLREPLLRSKDANRLYFRRDTHWNGRGAFIGYQSIIAALEPWFPNIGRMPASSFRELPSRRANPDLALLLGLGGVLTEGDIQMDPQPYHKATWLIPDAPPGKQPPWASECRSNPDLPRAVAFGDSFFGPMFGLMAEHFSRFVLVWNSPLDEAIIDREKPQVVIEEFVERKLFTPPPLPAALADQIAARKRVIR